MLPHASVNNNSLNTCFHKHLSFLRGIAVGALQQQYWTESSIYLLDSVQIICYIVAVRSLDKVQRLFKCLGHVLSYADNFTE